jgi:hypothetical protein
VEPALRHAGVTPMSSLSSPALPVWRTAKGQSAARRPWPCRRGTPRDSLRILAIHVPRAAPPNLSRRRAPGELPTLAAPGATPRPTTACHRRRRERRRDGGGKEPPAREPSTAKTGVARGRSRTRQERLLPLLPLLPRRRSATCFLFLLAGKPHRHTSPTRYTSARSQGGEDDCCFPLVDATAIEP